MALSLAAYAVFACHLHHANASPARLDHQCPCEYAWAMPNVVAAEPLASRVFAPFRPAPGSPPAPLRLHDLGSPRAPPAA